MRLLHLRLHRRDEVEGKRSVCRILRRAVVLLTLEGIVLEVEGRLGDIVRDV